MYNAIFDNFFQKVSHSVSKCLIARNPAALVTCCASSTRKSESIGHGSSRGAEHGGKGNHIRRKRGGDRHPLQRPRMHKTDLGRMKPLPLEPKITHLDRAAAVH